MLKYSMFAVSFYGKRGKVRIVRNDYVLSQIEDQAVEHAGEKVG